MMNALAWITTLNLAVGASSSPSSSPALDPAAGPCAADTVAVAVFARRFVETLPPALRVPRGAFVLVCGGSPAYAMGFGNTAAGQPVDPSRTVFRAASNSKLIVATAVFQLQERGLWQLTDDVNRYLPPAARLATGRFHRPVTLAALLTHTAGFEDKQAGGVAVPADRVTLAQFFQKPPRRVREPGFEVSYSNIGMALAGYLVEVRSGLPFSRYASEEVFLPLGMSRSTFEQPPPSSWAADLAAGSPRGARDIVFNPYPAASLQTTPADMGRFIAALLNGGALDDSLGGGRVLAPETTALMGASHWRAHPRVPGVAYGLFEGEINGRRTLFHTGDSGDHSVVFLLPDDSTGFYFVFTGTDEQTTLREQFAQVFMDTFYPAQTAVGNVPLGPVGSTRTDLAGTYRTAAYSRSNFEKLKALFAQVTVQRDDDGSLLLTPFGAPAPVHLLPKEPLVFQGDGGERIAFREDDLGKVVGLTVSGSIWDPGSWDRIGFLEDGRLHLMLFAGIALIALLRLLVWPVVALVARRVPRRGPPLSPRTLRGWRWSGRAALLLFLAPISAAATAFLSFSHPLRAVPRAVQVLGVVLLLATAAGLTLVPFTVDAWRARELSLVRRVHLTLLAGGFLVLAPMLRYWRLLPW